MLECCSVEVAVVVRQGEAGAEERLSSWRGVWRKAEGLFKVARDTREAGPRRAQMSQSPRLVL